MRRFSNRIQQVIQLDNLFHFIKIIKKTHFKRKVHHASCETMIDELMHSLDTRLSSKLIEPFQPDGCRWMLRRELMSDSFGHFTTPKGGIVADEVGLGKTILAICMMVLNPKPKTLVILPKSLVMQWKEHIHLFTSFVDVFVLSNAHQIQTSSFTTPAVYLISQSALNSKNKTIGQTPLHKIDWDRIIVD